VCPRFTRPIGPIAVDFESRRNILVGVHALALAVTLFETDYSVAL
jgi:hypothetical protein